MNERIEKLARQAWKEAYNVDPADPRIARAHKAMEEGMEKFAELIVREFSKQVQIEGRFGLEREQTLIRLCCENAKKHFGVEE